VSGFQNLIVSQTAGPVSVKFDRKAQLNSLGEIGIVLHLSPCPEGLGGEKTLKAEGNT